MDFLQRILCPVGSDMQLSIAACNLKIIELKGGLLASSCENTEPLKTNVGNLQSRPTEIYWKSKFFWAFSRENFGKYPQT
jgi:hypothetical protein